MSYASCIVIYSIVFLSPIVSNVVPADSSWFVVSGVQYDFNILYVPEPEKSWLPTNPPQFSCPFTLPIAYIKLIFTLHVLYVFAFLITFPIPAATSEFPCTKPVSNTFCTYTEHALLDEPASSTTLSILPIIPPTQSFPLTFPVEYACPTETVVAVFNIFIVPINPPALSPVASIFPVEYAFNIVDADNPINPPALFPVAFTSPVAYESLIEVRLDFPINPPTLLAPVTFAFVLQFNTFLEFSPINPPIFSFPVTVPLFTLELDTSTPYCAWL